MTGTTFHFVTDGLESALAQATDAADGLDVRIGGGVATVGAALRAGLVDEIHLAIVPVLVHRGERLYTDVGTWPEGYICAETAAGEGALHARFERA
jgi:dihydrofolate reductase